MGPHPTTNFPFVLLSRAVDHFDRIRAWSHAKRELPEPVQSSTKVVDTLDVASRRRLNALFATIRKKYRDVPDNTRHALQDAVYDVLASHLKATSRFRPKLGKDVS